MIDYQNSVEVLSMLKLLIRLSFLPHESDLLSTRLLWNIIIGIGIAIVGIIAVINGTQIEKDWGPNCVFVCVGWRLASGQRWCDGHGGLV